MDLGNARARVILPEAASTLLAGPTATAISKVIEQEHAIQPVRQKSSPSLVQIIFLNMFLLEVAVFFERIQ